MSNFEEMSDRLYSQLCELSRKDKLKITIEPIKSRIVGKKTYWETCNLCNLEINMECLTLYLQNELNTTIIKSEKEIIINGKYRGNELDNMLKKFIKKYHQCNYCNSLNSKIDNHPEIRKIKLFNCLDCKSMYNI